MLSRNPLKLAGQGLERLIRRPTTRHVGAGSKLTVVSGARVLPSSICYDMQTLEHALNEFDINGNVDLLDVEMLERVSNRLGTWDPFNQLAHEMNRILDHAREIKALGD